MLHWTIWGREPGVHEASLRRYGRKLGYHITVYFLFTLVTVTCKYNTLTQLMYHSASYNSCSNWRPPTSIQAWQWRTRFCRTLKWGCAPSCCVHILSRTAKGSPHFSVDVRNHLNAVFPDHWIWRGGPIPLSARSSDLNPLHYFLWGYLKSLVFETSVETDMQLVSSEKRRLLLFCSCCTAYISLEIMRNFFYMFDVVYVKLNSISREFSSLNVVATLWRKRRDLCDYAS